MTVSEIIERKNVASVKTDDKSLAIHIFPNHVKSIANIQLKSAITGAVRYIISDAKRISNTGYENGFTKWYKIMYLNMAGVSPGTYTLKVEYNGKQVTSTFVKL